MTVKWQFEDYWMGQAKTATFHYTGTVQHFVVPDTVTEITVTLRGGAGGGESIDPVAHGGYVAIKMPVTPGETLNLRVGGNGGRIIPSAAGAPGGYNGGGHGGATTGGGSTTGGYGGGGASDIRQGGDTLDDRVAVAAGGGGNSGERNSHGGGPAGYPSGSAGNSVAGPPPFHTVNLYGGAGGKQTAGGVGGTGSTSTCNGSYGIGGPGQSNTVNNGAGGGGAGLFGGGGGGTGSSGQLFGGGGGGGSNGVIDTVTVINNGSGGRSVLGGSPPLITIEFTQDADVYVWEINPNDGGSPTATKNIHAAQNTGPNRVGILQEGQSQVSTIAFSGIILTQQQYEALELWYDRRALIKLTDDLGRTFYGVFSKFNAKRARRAHNFWYHTYDAEFMVSAYVSASGNRVYGRVS